MVDECGRILKEPAESAQEITASQDDQCKKRGDDRPRLHGLLILDRIELVDHLRQAPGPKGNFIKTDVKRCKIPSDCPGSCTFLISKGMHLSLYNAAVPGTMQWGSAIFSMSLLKHVIRHPPDPAHRELPLFLHP